MTTAAPKIYVAGHRGMVGSATVRHLLANGHPFKQRPSATFP
jgi:GDP-L-fucose synthase